MRYLKPSFWVFILDFRADMFYCTKSCFSRCTPLCNPAKKVLEKSTRISSQKIVSLVLCSKCDSPGSPFPKHPSLLRTLYTWVCWNLRRNGAELLKIMMKCVDSEHLTHFQKRRRTWTWKRISIGVMFHNFPSCFLAFKAVVFPRNQPSFIGQLVAINFGAIRGKGIKHNPRRCTGFLKQVSFYILVGTCLNIVTGKMQVIYPPLHGFGNHQHSGIFCFMDF